MKANKNSGDYLRDTMFWLLTEEGATEEPPAPPPIDGTPRRDDEARSGTGEMRNISADGTAG